MAFLNFLSRIWKERKVFFIIIVCMMIFMALLEAFKILLVVPLFELIVGNQLQTSTAHSGLIGKAVFLMSHLSKALNIPLSLEFILIFIVTVYSLSGILYITLMHMVYKSRTSFSFSLAHKMFGSCFASSWAFFINHKPGKLVNILAVEVNRAGLAYQYTCHTIANLFIGLFFVLLAMLISWKLTLIVFFIAPLLFILLRQITRISQKNGIAVTQANNNLQAEAFENILAAKMIKGSASETKATGIIDGLIKKAQYCFYRNGMCEVLLTALQEPIGTLILALVLYSGLRYFELKPQVLVLILLLFFRLTPRFYEMQRNYQIVAANIPALHEIDRVIEEAKRTEEKGGRRLFTQLEKGIALKDVHYSYGNSKPVLQGVTFEIPRGKIVGIVGQSGSGKTTIVDLIVGLIKAEKGEILIDEAPLSEYEIASWRRYVGYVTQEVHLFHDTVLENIRWNKPNAKDEEVERAVKLANAQEFIMQMPQGFSTVIGDRGFRLSGGQRQRLQLARVILTDPQLFIFDEATSSLDSESERSIQEAINSLAKTRTTFIIAHRISTLKNVDSIYVLDGCRIIESGSWDELMAKDGEFKRIAKMQNV